MAVQKEKTPAALFRSFHFFMIYFDCNLLSANDDEKYSCQDLTVWAIFVDSDEKIVVCNGCAHAGGVRRNHGKGHGARGFALVCRPFSGCSGAAGCGAVESFGADAGPGHRPAALSAAG